MNLWISAAGCIVVMIAGGCATRSPEPNPAPKAQPLVVSEPEIQHRIPPETERKMMEFAIRESPSLYKAVETLKAKIEVQEGRIKELKSALELLDKNPMDDPDYVAFQEDLRQMEKRLADVKEQIKAAYFASLKYNAQPSTRETADFERTATKEGVEDAVSIRKKYEAMKEQK